MNEYWKGKKQHKIKINRFGMVCVWWRKWRDTYFTDIVNLLSNQQWKILKYIFIYDFIRLSNIYKTFPTILMTIEYIVYALHSILNCAKTLVKADRQHIIRNGWQKRKKWSVSFSDIKLGLAPPSISFSLSNIVYCATVRAPFDNRFAITLTEHIPTYIYERW